VILSGCDDLSMVTCYGVAATLVSMAEGQHLSVVDSYMIHAACLSAIGPCVDSHPIAGGTQELSNDTAIKVVDNYAEGTGENFLFGGGASQGVPTDMEFRRNHFYKPLSWKNDNALFPGKVFDTFIANSRYGSGY